MELHQIRYFLAVADLLNFTRAAERCNVTQPALTRAIQKLEDELGGLLFFRERAHTQLTDLGRLIRPHLEQILNGTEAAKTTATSFLSLDSAPFSLGVMCSVGPLRFVNFLTRFRDENPGVELAIREGQAQPLLQQLMDGELDAAIVAQPDAFPERIDARPLYRERFAVVVAPGHRFAALPEVRVADLKGECYLARTNCEYRDHIKRVREENGAVVRFGFRSEREDWIQTMVAAGLGFCIMPEFSPTLPGLVSRRLVDPPIEREVALATVAGRRFSPALSAFLRSARAYTWPEPGA